MRLAVLITTLLIAAWITAVSDWASAMWFVGVVGFLYWVFSTVIEAIARLAQWLSRPKRQVIAIQISPEPELPEIVDAEVIEERDVKKWWRV